MDLNGKVAVVTGASSGIGEATARALAAQGMQVVATARRQDRLEALAESRPNIRPVRTDVTVDEDVRALAEVVADEYGACHALINNAGLSLGARFRGPDDVADLERVMDTNFAGAVRCTAAFAALLFASAPSRVVNVASVAGKIGAGSPPGYAASKFALVGFSESLVADWGRRGVAVTQLNPGFVRTEGFPQDRFAGTPIRRLVASPEDVASAIVDAVRRGPRERTVPRWYRPFVTLRHLVPGLVWGVVRRTT